MSGIIASHRIASVGDALTAILFFYHENNRTYVRKHKHKHIHFASELLYILRLFSISLLCCQWITILTIHAFVVNLCTCTHYLIWLTRFNSHILSAPLEIFNDDTFQVFSARSARFSAIYTIRIFAVCNAHTIFRLLSIVVDFIISS